MNIIKVSSHRNDYVFILSMVSRSIKDKIKKKKLQQRNLVVLFSQLVYSFLFLFVFFGWAFWFNWEWKWAI